MNLHPASDRQKPRVLHCITRLGLGGAERVALSIARALKQDADFAVFTAYSQVEGLVGDSMREELRAAGIPWYPGTRLSIKTGGMISGGRALQKAIVDFKPHVVHFHSEVPEACGAVMQRLHGGSNALPMVRTIHNSIFWRYWPRIGRWTDRQLNRAHIAAVSHAALAEFQRYRLDSGAATPVEVDPCVIYNGVALPTLPPHAAPHRPGHRRVLFAGRLELQKGPDILAQAIPLVRLPPETTAELICLGHGNHVDLLRDLSANPPPRWRVEMREPAPNLPEVMTEFDIVVVPSRFEGLALVAVEATLCGLPVVAAMAPGLREALPRNYPWRPAPESPQAFAVALSDALQETEKWKDAVQKAQRYAADHFSPDAMAANYLALYRTAMRTRTG